LTIIISKDGESPKKVERTDFANEDEVQELIHDNVESLPFYDQNEDLRLLSLGREFSTDHGPSDVIGIDENGDIYIIEAKLHKNPTRREVVAQVIDYGAAIWAEYKKFETFETKVKEWNMGQSLFQIIKNKDIFSELDDVEIESLIEKVKNNLQTGNFKFVIVMDKLDQKLTNAIDFLNSKSSFAIYAVTFDYYKPDGFKIIIPNVYGREAEKSSTIKSNSVKHKWSEEEFEQKVSHNTNFTETERKSISKLIDFTKEMMSPDWKDYWHQYFENTGKDPLFMGYLPSIDENKPLYRIKSEDGSLVIRLGVIKNPNDKKKFLDECTKKGFELGTTAYAEDTNRIPMKKEEWMPKVDQFISILRESFS
jgi:hypothetical protein